MTCEAASGILGNFEILQAGINANYNIARVLAVSTSFRVDEIKFFICARPCVYKMTCFVVFIRRGFSPLTFKIEHNDKELSRIFGIDSFLAT